MRQTLRGIFVACYSYLQVFGVKHSSKPTWDDFPQVLDLWDRVFHWLRGSPVGLVTGCVAWSMTTCYSWIMGMELEFLCLEERHFTNWVLAPAPSLPIESTRMIVSFFPQIWGWSKLSWGHFSIWLKGLGFIDCGPVTPCMQWSITTLFFPLVLPHTLK